MTIGVSSRWWVVTIGVSGRWRVFTMGVSGRWWVVTWHRGRLASGIIDGEVGKFFGGNWWVVDRDLVSWVSDAGSDTG